MAHRYRVYIAAVSYKKEYRPKELIGCENIGYAQTVLANGCLDALKICLPRIREELYKLQGKYVSVFVGRKHDHTAYASRLWPIQVVIETGKIRKTHLSRSHLCR